MLEITSIEKGIVIDHITAGYGIQVFNYLNLDKADYNVALICNAYSQKMGKKTSSRSTMSSTSITTSSG